MMGATVVGTCFMNSFFLKNESYKYWTPSVVDPDPHASALVWLFWMIGNTDPDPDLGAWKLTKINKRTWFFAFQKVFLPL
jgi:hypothetical protein